MCQQGKKGAGNINIDFFRSFQQQEQEQEQQEQ
jgi:hypothetical protein